MRRLAIAFIGVLLLSGQAPVAGPSQTREGGSTEVSILGVRISLGELLLGLGTFGLWYATQRLVGEAKATSQRQLRAYVLPEVASVVDYGDVVPTPPAIYAGKVGSVVVIKNSGQTPAYKLCHWSTVAIVPKTAEESLVPPGTLDEIGATTVGPGCTIHRAGWSENIVSAADAAAVRAGTSAIYIYGKITYIDAFKRKRESSYRLWYAGHYPPSNGATLQFCLHGNTST